MSWKDVVITKFFFLFCFFKKPDCNEVSKDIKFVIVCAYAARLGSFINRSLQTGCIKCVKQVRETCQLDNCVR